MDFIAAKLGYRDSLHCYRRDSLQVQVSRESIMLVTPVHNQAPKDLP
jgi:hypothetical protein